VHKIGSPLIKIYQLPQAYTQDSDNDVQTRQGDEVVPVVPKFGQLSDVKNSAPLTGAIVVAAGDLYCFNHNGGTRTVENVIPHPIKTSVYIPQTADWSSVLHEPVGVLAPILKDSDNNPLALSAYSFTPDGITFTGSTIATTIGFFAKSAIGSSSTFALAGDTFYRGVNPTFNRLLVSKDGAEYAIATMPADGAGYIAVTGVTTSLKATYAVTATSAKQFISEHPNWVGGHIGLWPDVFVGLYDYPGDQYTDAGGTPIEPGLVPKFRDPGTYSVNFRDGMVEFPTAIDSSATPVRANYAYLTNVANVTNQKLDAVSGSGNLAYQADTELLFTDSHGKRWCNRDDNYTPINVYVNGALTPQPTSVTPYDTLDVKLS
jgi:hypothetical protein